MLTGSDGYDYEDLQARLLGEKANTPLNEGLDEGLSRARREGKDEAWCREYAKAYRTLYGVTTYHRLADDLSTEYADAACEGRGCQPHSGLAQPDPLHHSD
jgi:hypothetical protein